MSSTPEIHPEPDPVKRASERPPEQWHVGEEPQPAVRESRRTDSRAELERLDRQAETARLARLERQFASVDDPARSPQPNRVEAPKGLRFPESVARFFTVLRNRAGYSTGFRFGDLTLDFARGNRFLGTKSGIDAIRDVRLETHDGQPAIAIELCRKDDISANRGDLLLPIVVIEQHPEYAALTYEGKTYFSSPAAKEFFQQRLRRPGWRNMDPGS